MIVKNTSTNYIDYFIMYFQFLCLGTSRTQNGQHSTVAKDQALKHQNLPDCHLTIVVYLLSLSRHHIVTPMVIFLSMRHYLSILNSLNTIQ